MGNSQDNKQHDHPAGKEGKDSNAVSRNNLRELVEESFQHLREGDVVRGTVVAIDDSDVVVDIGFKSEGIIPRSEFVDREGKVTVKPGDEVDVLVERFDENIGEIRLSRERAAKIRVWEVLETAYRDGLPVRGKVVERVKGGLAVDIGVRAFLPGSLVDLRPTRRLEDYVGEEVEARIINFDRRRANVVLSRKVMLEAQLSTQKVETLTHLEEGGARQHDVDLLKKISDNMMGNTVCVLADAAAMPVISFVTKFRAEFEEHLRFGRCPHRPAVGAPAAMAAHA